MKFEQLESMLPGENPLKYGNDLNNGHNLGDNLFVQYKNHPCDTCKTIILIDTKTGERYRVTL